MRTLLLLRHAKSSRDDPSLDDIDRPLTDRGRKAARLIGREMAARRWVPDVTLVSPAVRTRETWAIAGAEIEGAADPTLVATLYEAGPEDILDAIRSVPAATGTVVVVGHNPGLEDCAAAIAGPASSSKALKALREKFPTGGLARFRCPRAWSALDSDRAALLDFIRPRDLG